jgi:hypothetical protein
MRTLLNALRRVASATIALLLVAPRAGAEALSAPPLVHQLL